MNDMHGKCRCGKGCVFLHGANAAVAVVISSVLSLRRPGRGSALPADPAMATYLSRYYVPLAPPPIRAVDAQAHTCSGGAQSPALVAELIARCVVAPATYVASPRGDGWSASGGWAPPRPSLAHSFIVGEQKDRTYKLKSRSSKLMDVTQTHARMQVFYVLYISQRNNGNTGCWVIILEPVSKWAVAEAFSETRAQHIIRV